MGGATAVWLKLILNEDLFVKHPGPEWIGSLGWWSIWESLDFIGIHPKTQRFCVVEEAQAFCERDWSGEGPYEFFMSWCAQLNECSECRCVACRQPHPQGGCWHRNTLAHFQRESWADKGFSDSAGLSSFDLCCCCSRQPLHLEPSLVNEWDKLCRFISVFNLRRCLRDVFLLWLLNGESSHNV